MNSDPARHIPTSEILDRLLRDASPEHVTLAWLLGSLRERSFGIFLILLGLLGLVPGASTFTAFVLLIPAFQMIMQRPAPILPASIGGRKLSTRSVAWLMRRVIPALRWLERFAYPRWQTPFESTKRAIGAVVMLLAITLLSPIPFAHVIPNIVIMLIAFSFLEQDGVLLLASLLLAALSLAITTAGLWATIVVPQLL